MKHIVILLSIIFCFVSFSQAAEPDRLAALEAQIKSLTARVEALELQLKTLTAAPLPTPIPKLKPSATKDIPADIDAQIKAIAVADYPDNNTMQLYVIKKERTAYQKMQTLTSDIPLAEFTKIKAAAIADYPTNYTMQLYVIEKEIEAYKELH